VRNSTPSFPQSVECARVLTQLQNRIPPSFRPTLTRFLKDKTTPCCRPRFRLLPSLFSFFLFRGREVDLVVFLTHFRIQERGHPGCEFRDFQRFFPFVSVRGPSFFFEDQPRAGFWVAFPFRRVQLQMKIGFLLPLLQLDPDPVTGWLRAERVLLADKVMQPLVVDPGFFFVSTSFQEADAFPP